jgi:hypothetical protein
MPQSTIARLESQGSNPRVQTLERVLLAAGARLEMEPGAVSGVDETLIAQNLEVQPAERLRRFRVAYANVRGLRGSLRLIDGDVA